MLFASAVVWVFGKIRHSIAVAKESQKARNFIDGGEKAKGIYANNVSRPCI